MNGYIRKRKGNKIKQATWLSKNGIKKVEKKWQKHSKTLEYTHKSGKPYFASH
jgi:hypothetical protein